MWGTAGTEDKTWDHHMTGISHTAAQSTAAKAQLNAFVHEQLAAKTGGKLSAEQQQKVNQRVNQMVDQGLARVGTKGPIRWWIKGWRG